ncbi:TetR/AcrR family transcriptional regulator [Actinoallomurus vinaceus]|uniref:TetR/AcrR family transcriptional regulator n=1 Tax=Actinoallomurus vinaceus TaxID=1080074 RepID=A0ABP8U8R8_9ACTN
MTSDARERMIRSAAYLFRERGYSGTAFSDVIKHSGAPRGSIYHHFPGGKEQLAEEAVRYAGDYLGAGVRAAMRDDDPVAAVHAFLGWWRRVLVKSDFRAGCPIAAVTVESGTVEPRLTEAAASAFRRWQEALAAGLLSAGATNARAGRLATMIVAAVEGATVMCRAQRSLNPLDDVIAELEELITSACER